MIEKFIGADPGIEVGGTRHRANIRIGEPIMTPSNPMNYTSKEVEARAEALNGLGEVLHGAITQEEFTSLWLAVDQLQAFAALLKSREDAKAVAQDRVAVALREPNSAKAAQVASSLGHPPADSGEAKDALRWRTLLATVDEVVGSSWVWQRDDDEMMPLEVRVDNEIAVAAMTAESREGE